MRRFLAGGQAPPKRLFSRFGVFAIGLAAVLGGCTQHFIPSEESNQNPTEDPDQGISLDTGWVFRQGDCEQRLTLTAAGRFALQATVFFQNGHHRETIEGDYLLANSENPSPQTVSFSPETTISPDDLFYCGQWDDRREVSFPVQELEQALGIDPVPLVFHSEVSPVLGPVLLGADEARHDRLALHRDATGGVALTILPGTQAIETFFYRAHFFDGNLSLKNLDKLSVIPLPEGFYNRSFPTAVSGRALEKLFINVGAASEVELSAKGHPGMVPCNLEIYSNRDFSKLLTQVTVPFGQESLSFSANPADPGHDFILAHPMSPGGETDTAYIIPAMIKAPPEGACAINLRGKPMAVSYLESRKADGLEPDFILGNLGPVASVMAALPDGGVMDFHPALSNTVRRWNAITPKVFSIPTAVLDETGAPPFFDALALLTSGGQEVELSLQVEGEVPVLNIFPSPSELEGMGPFQQYQRPPSGETLLLPSTLVRGFSEGETSHLYTLTLETETRVDISTSGMDTVGLLSDSAGLELLRTDNGGADGAGFRLVVTLPAGEYDLTVTGKSPPGEYTLTTAVAVTSFPDDALQRCVLDAAPGPRLLVCNKKGVATMEGLGSLPTLEGLFLGDNDLSDLSALQELPLLRELSLEGNPITEISPLAGLPHLARLSLARCPLGADQLPSLAGLADRLRILDLSGVTGLTLEQVTELKGSLINTTIIAPDGAILD